jgi:hypothetical protein
MGRGILPPVHGVLDYPLAAVLIVLPLVLSFDDAAAKWIAFGFSIGAVRPNDALPVKTTGCNTPAWARAAGSKPKCPGPA